MRTLNQILRGELLPEFLAKCSVDFELWCTRVMQDPVDHTKGLDIQPFHMEWFDMAENNRRSCIVAHRGSGKTNLLGITYPLWKSFFNQRKEFIIVSDTLEQATKILSNIRETIESNELLLQLKPKSTSKTWKAKAIDTTTQCKIYTMPYSDRIRGNHVNYLLLDECGEYKNHSLLRAAVTPCVVKKRGHIVAIGTRKSETDMLNMLKKKKVYKYAEYPAEDKDGNILWEAAFPRKELKRIKKEIGIIAYTREYLCVPTSGEASFFPMRIVEPCCDETLTFSKEIKGRAFFGIDFAYSQDRHADYTVIIVGDKIGNKVYIRYIERFRGLSIEEQENKIRELYTMYKPVKVMMDSSNVGTNFVQRLRGEMPAYPVKFDPKNRLENLINLRSTIDRGELVIPRNAEDMNCMGKTNILIDELTSCIEDTTPSGAMTIKTTGIHDDVCFIAGTLIETPIGSVSIETLKVGDYVLTRKGPKRIIATSNRLSNVINKFGFTGTPDHPFFTKDGIKELKYLKETDTIYMWNQKSLSIEERIIGDIRKLKDGILEYITGIMENGKHPLLPYIDNSGLTIMEKSQKDTSSIIEMGILSTMNSQISNASQEKNMWQSIILPNEKRIPDKILKKIGKRLLKYLKRDGGKARNCESMEKEMQNTSIMLQNIDISVPSVEENIIVQESKEQNTAHMNVIKDILENQEKLRSIDNDKNSSIRRVYNLQIEDTPEYFANSILVHNCMALVCLIKGTTEELGVVDYIAANKDISKYHFDEYRNEDGKLPKKFVINTWS